MAGGVLPLRRAEGRLETHPAASHHGRDSHRLGDVLGPAAIHCVHEAGQPQTEPLSDLDPDLFPHPVAAATGLHAFDSFSPKSGQHSSDAIVVNKRRMEDGEVYVTDLREPLSRSPQDRTFFARLDAELTQVNKFYKKEAENISRAGDLEKQMLELINAEEAIARQDLPDFTCPKTREHMWLVIIFKTRRNCPANFLALIQEGMERSNSLLMRPSASVAHGNSHEDDETKDAIRD